MKVQAQPTYGNYKGYYEARRNASVDSRLALLSRDFFKDKEVLDIGCNEGWVTCEIAQQWSPANITGVDIDPDLIDACWKRLGLIWSLQKDVMQPTDSDGLQRKKRKRKNDDLVGREALQASHYFPLAFHTLYGEIPAPAQDSTEKGAAFPYNVTFRCEDWLVEPQEPDARYDVVLVLSITKWIHLNHGDKGITSFFQRVFNSLRPNSGSTLVLEPQHWEGYAKAKRMDPTLKKTYQSLELRPEHFDGLLRGIGFLPPRELGSTGQGGLNRPLLLYVRP